MNSEPSMVENATLDELTSSLSQAVDWLKQLGIASKPGDRLHSAIHAIQQAQRFGKGSNGKVNP
jgi:hypothetical protein